MDFQLQYFAPIAGNLIRYFLFAGIPFLIFYVLWPDAFSKNKIQSRLARQKDFLREIGHSVQSSIIFGIVIALFLFTPLRNHTQIYDHLSAFAMWWVPVSILLALVIHDTYFYWMHRLVHHPKLYKAVHLMHHKSINPSPWASYSFHFFEAVAEALIVPILVFTLPMHPLSLAVFGLLSFMINVYGHLGYEVMPRWFRKSFLFDILNTSVHHNLHHEKFKGNYGLYFRIWDRLMGTEHPDYVQAYDSIQQKRFGTNIKKFAALSVFAEKLSWLILLLIGLSVCAATAQSTIEGKWKEEEGGGVILIYQQGEAYFGQLISADHPEDNEKIKDRQIILLKNFERQNDREFCCGTIYQPKEKRLLTGTLTLLNHDTLQIKGQYKIYTGTRIWKRLED